MHPILRHLKVHERCWMYKLEKCSATHLKIITNFMPPCSGFAWMRKSSDEFRETLTFGIDHESVAVVDPTYPGCRRSGLLSVFALSGHSPFSQASVREAVRIKQMCNKKVRHRDDGWEKKKPVSTGFRLTSSSLSLSEPTLHKLWLEDSFWFGPEPC